MPTLSYQTFTKHKIFMSGYLNYDYLCTQKALSNGLCDYKKVADLPIFYAVEMNGNEDFDNKAGIVGLSPSTIIGTDSMLDSVLQLHPNFQQALSFYSKPISEFVLGYYNDTIPAKYTNDLIHYKETIEGR
jgi:hypothetical protein